MTRWSSRREVLTVVVCLLVALGLIGMFLWQDGSSLERGNRLYRDGQVWRAEPLYRLGAESSMALSAAVYNLGTALLALGTPEAEEYLRLATEADDSAVAQRGHYNLGHSFLTQVELGEPGSWTPLLAAAIGSNRAALRLDPGDQSARWNLALAQLMLDNLTPVSESDEVPLSDTGSQLEGGVIVPQPGDDEGPPPTEGGREALAGDDPGFLTEDEALLLLEAMSDDPEQLLWGILWSQRPEVIPGLGSYPGGNW